MPRKRRTKLTHRSKPKQPDDDSSHSMPEDEEKDRLESFLKDFDIEGIAIGYNSTDYCPNYVTCLLGIIFKSHRFIFNKHDNCFFWGGGEFELTIS